MGSITALAVGPESVKGATVPSGVEAAHPFATPESFGSAPLYPVPFVHVFSELEIGQIAEAVFCGTSKFLLGSLSIAGRCREQWALGPRVDRRQNGGVPLGQACPPRAIRVRRVDSR